MDVLEPVRFHFWIRDFVSDKHFFNLDRVGRPIDQGDFAFRLVDEQKTENERHEQNGPLQ